MTTVDNFLRSEDVQGFVSLLKDWPNSEYGDDSAMLAVSPFTTFYFSYEPKNHIDTSLSMVDVHESFEALTGRPYKIGTHPDSERPHPYDSKRLPDRREFARKTKLNKQFIFNATSETNHLSSPTTAGYFWRSSTWDGINNNGYSSVQFYYRWQWWLDNRDAWCRFVLKTAELLRADQVYSGFAMANPLDIGARSEVAVWERSLAQHFHGLDIDFPFGMDSELTSGIRTPTWAFLLSNHWRDKLGLGREQVRAALADPRIAITEMEVGQWIELGEKPDLYPVENGVPELPAMLNRLLKPIRSQELGLVGFGQWDGDPNERFNRADSLRWLGRFDGDSDWPTALLRSSPVGKHFDPSVVAPPVGTLAGEPCPRAGYWFTPATLGSRRQFQQGEVMPDTKSSWGATIWQWDVNQSD